VERSGGAEFLTGLGRAFGGAILFSFPLLMTAEMWDLGATMDRYRLVIFIAGAFPVLAGLAWYCGFERTATPREAVEDAVVAFGVGFVTSAVILLLLDRIAMDMSVGEIVGRIGIQAVPAAIGAVVARRQLTGGEDVDRQERASYGGELFLMAAGALFIAFNVAPTEEMVLIASTMTARHSVGLIALSVLMLHVLVYQVGFAGQEERPDYAGFGLTFLHFTLAGYGIALLVSLAVLWTFERTVGTGIADVATMAVVLGFPAALGAAVARLIV
jgi:putative integral membrane protein (TIGR02587 family)